MVVDSFGLRSQARRPGTYFALGVGMTVVYLCVTLEMDSLVLALAALYVGVVMIRLALNPARGFQVDRNRIQWFNGRKSESVRLEELDSVSIGQMKKNRIFCVMNLSDGRVLELPGVEKLSAQRLAWELRRRGIPVMR